MLPDFFTVKKVFRPLVKLFVLNCLYSGIFIKIHYIIFNRLL